jgi:hypothetical protein
MVDAKGAGVGVKIPISKSQIPMKSQGPMTDEEIPMYMG